MTFNWWTFLFESLNFVVLAYVLHRLLYRPLRDAIEKRGKANVRAQVEAERARHEAEAIKERLGKQLAEAEQERQKLIHLAREQAEAERQKLLAEAEQAVQRRQEEARRALEREREESLKSLRSEVIAQAVELTRRLLSGASERSLHQQLALRLLQTLQQLSGAEKENVRASWQSGDGPVLESAQDLDTDTFEQLTKAVSGIVGQPVTLTMQSRPELVGGVRLRLAGHVWDGSLSGQISIADSWAREDRQR